MRFRSLGQEDPREEGMATQYSFLENPTDRGARRAAAHRAAKSQTGLSGLARPATNGDALETLSMKGNGSGSKTRVMTVCLRGATCLMRDLAH